MMAIDLKRSFLGALTTLLLGVFGIQLCFVALLILPSNFFFQYIKLTIVEPVYIGKQIRVQSFLDRYWELNMTYSDTLFCKETHDGPFYVYSSQTTEIANAEVKNSEKTFSSWIYTSPVPSFETVCYIHSTIYATLPFNIRKLQTIRSTTFDVKKAA